MLNITKRTSFSRIVCSFVKNFVLFSIFVLAFWIRAKYLVSKKYHASNTRSFLHFWLNCKCRDIITGYEKAFIQIYMYIYIKRGTHKDKNRRGMTYCKVARLVLIYQWNVLSVHFRRQLEKRRGRKCVYTLLSFLQAEWQIARTRAMLSLRKENIFLIVRGRWLLQRKFVLWNWSLTDTYKK